ncbi:unnamed protein product [marine sediment metagenome]|uniref:GIY-YIG domain-containing protein n=1 Tax=marine sediment metagenome TaxID=412755 RepID=X1U7M5_9ZZZZ
MKNDDHYSEMKERFKKLADRMPLLLQSLLEQPLIARDNIGIIQVPERGVYIFYENDAAIYVGRSNRLKQRIQEHSRPSSMHNSASFAFNIAKEIIARHLDIPKDATRKQLEKAPGFDRLFYEAKARVARMKIRVKGVDDQVTQALFEIYAALTLNTKYNDFSTH